jgi:peptidyl-prolyl cis-trans isomerase C
MMRNVRDLAGLWRWWRLAAPVWAEGETADTVVATVNGTKITLGQMIALRETCRTVSVPAR